MDLVKTIALFSLFIITVCGVPIINRDDIWWRNQYFYQIQVQEFKDSDGDGLGDLRGITENIDHLKSLRVETIILSPIFQAEPDNCSNYLVLNYENLNGDYGDFEDFRELVTETGKAGIKVILDLSLDRMSVSSEWYKLCELHVEGYENFFKNNDDKNNAKSSSIDSSDTLHDNDEWKEKGNGVQLNYFNPHVLTKLIDVLKFWLGRGVMGFRMIENVNFDFNEISTRNMLQMLRIFIDDTSKQHEGLQRIFIGQSLSDSRQNMHQNYGSSKKAFHILHCDNFVEEFEEDSTAQDTKYIIEKTLTYSDEVQIPTWIIGNSDNTRIASRIGRSKSEILTMILFLLPGNIITKQGDEIGMTDEKSSTNSHCQTAFNKCVFQWDDSENAGFSTASNLKAIKVCQNYLTVNLKKQNSESRSFYKQYKVLSSVRRSPTIKEGDVNVRIVPLTSVLLVSRHLEGQESFILAANFGPHVQAANLTKFRDVSEELTVILSSLQSTYSQGDRVSASSIRLSKGEAVVFVALNQQCRGTKPVDKIVGKLNDAMQKISTYLSF